MRNGFKTGILLFLCAAAPVAMAAEEIAAKSAIASVTVFPDRATVTREAALDLPQGAHSVLFDGLPAALYPNSLRVTGKGTAAVKILGIDSAPRFLESPFLPEMKKIQAEIEAVEFEISKVRDALDVLDAKEKFLKSIESSSSNRASQDVALGKPDPVSWEKTISFLETKLQEIKTSRLDKTKGLKDLEAKRDALRKKLESMRPQRGKEAKNVTVLLEASKAGTFTLSLSYTVPNTQWSPLYTMRALPDTSEVEMAMSANILQRSGENWENVKAILSTSSPSQGTTPPELNPWNLDIFTPPPPAPPTERMRAVARAPKPMTASEEIDGGVVGGAAKDKETEAVFDMAGLVESGLHVGFDIKRTIQIPSDGTPHKVPIDSFKLKAKFDYFAVPKLREAAYLRGKVKNTMSYPFLTGQADLFILQDFVGSSNLPFTAPEDEAKFYFGEDNQVSVKRELVKQEKSGPGFLGKKDKSRFVYRITIQNFRKNPVEIEVVDQIPVSRNSQIEVTNVSFTPNSGKKDEKGLLTWALTLNPQEKKEILIDCTIEYPKGIQIVGM